MVNKQKMINVKHIEEMKQNIQKLTENKDRYYGNETIEKYNYTIYILDLLLNKSEEI